MLEAEPNDPFCLYGLAQEYAKQGDLDQAVDMYERTIEADPAYCYAYYHFARVHGERSDRPRLPHAGDRPRIRPKQSAIRKQSMKSLRILMMF
jgi:tetratricopeptide (TPR) repeat protein